MLHELQSDLRAAADPDKAAFSPRFFKSGPGQYGEADKFLGVTVPNQRKIAKTYRDLWLGDIERLLASPWHEERLTGLFILVDSYERGSQQTKQEVYNFYITHLDRVNNWDLVDSSAEHIIGPHLQNSPYKMKVLTKLASTGNLWERRIAMLSTFHYIKQGRADEALEIARILLQDEHDLIHKAVGWMLRETSQRCHDSRCPVRTSHKSKTLSLRSLALTCAASPDNDLNCTETILTRFLDEYAATMPRTALRYAIEKFPEAQRKRYLKAR